MDVQESTDSGRIMGAQSYEPRILVVVVDASRELRLAPLKYALDISEPGDKLYVLGILHHVRNPMGYKQMADTGTNFNNLDIVFREQRKAEAAFQRCMDGPDLQKLFAAKKVNPVVQTATGPDRKVVTAREATKLGAKWVILDKHLKKDKNFLSQHLNCNLVLMESKNRSFMIRVEEHQIGHGNWISVEEQLKENGNSLDCVNSGLLAARQTSIVEDGSDTRQPKEAHNGDAPQDKDLRVAAMNDMSLRELPKPVATGVSKSSIAVDHRLESRPEGRSERQQFSSATFGRRVGEFWATLGQLLGDRIRS